MFSLSLSLCKAKTQSSKATANDKRARIPGTFWLRVCFRPSLFSLSRACNHDMQLEDKSFVTLKSKSTLQSAYLHCTSEMKPRLICCVPWCSFSREGRDVNRAASKAKLLVFWSCMSCTFSILREFFFIIPLFISLKSTLCYLCSANKLLLWNWNDETSAREN